MASRSIDRSCSALARARDARPLAEGEGARSAETEGRPLCRPAGPARTARCAGQRAPPVGPLQRGRLDQAELAPGAPRSRAGRLRHRSRGGAPRRAQPFEALLEPGRPALSRVARGARAAGARGRVASPVCHARLKSMRILHTMLRVGDLDRSVRFYTEVLGMKLLRTTDRPAQQYKT